jgi:hypothetical protein
MDISNNSDLDDMTLRLMSNKKCLNSYLKNTDQVEYEKIRMEEEAIATHEKNIIKITYDLLKGDVDNYSSDIINSFNNYVKNIIRHIEISNMKDNTGYQDTDEDIFTNMENNKKVLPNVFGYNFERKI